MVKEEGQTMSNATLTNRHETLFSWDVRKSNPNGDPSGNEPRIDRHTKKCDVTDVCIKRSVRDFIRTKEGIDSLLVTKLGEDAAETKTLTDRIIDYLFANDEKAQKTRGLIEKLVKERLDKGKDSYKEFHEKPSSSTLKEILSTEKKDKDKLKKIVLNNADLDSIQNDIARGLRAYLCGTFKDLRMFGSVLALEKDLNSLGGPLTGPIQIEVGTSLHRVVQSNKQITSVMGSKEEKEAGIIGDTHCIEYGFFATSAVANENAARFTGLSDEDHALFLKALWRGTRDRHTRSKNQVPRLLIDIEYGKPFHFGDLVNSVKLNPVKRDEKLVDEESYRSIDDFTIDLTRLNEKLKARKEIIKSIKFASNGLISLKDFQDKLDNSLKNKVCEISDIDYDLSKHLKDIVLSDEAKKVLAQVKGISYCEPQKVLSITPELSEEALKQLLENPALSNHKEFIQKAYNELKGA